MNPLHWMLPIGAGVLGALVGSFLNVVIYRLPRPGLSVTRPARSFCPACRSAITWWDNLPIASWLLLGGRCRSCKSPITARYVVVETVTALLFAALADHCLSELRHYGASGLPAELLIGLISGWFLLCVTVVVFCIDLEHQIIPNAITLPGLAVGLAAALLAPSLQESSRVFHAVLGAGAARFVAGLASAVAGAFCGAITVFAVGILGRIGFRQDSMGMGDVKYMALLGSFLGTEGVLLVFFLGCITGALGGLVQRWVSGHRVMPFGPYLSAGVVCVLFRGAQIQQFLLQDWPRWVRGLMSS